MLFAQSGTGSRVELGDDAASLHVARQAVWLDLVQPTPAERRVASQVIGHELPERADLDEIEQSSRLYDEDGALFMSMSLFSQVNGTSVRSPLGLVLTKDHLVTIRYVGSPVFDTVAARFAAREDLPCSGMDTMVALLEALVDRVADALERVGALLDGVSSSLFSDQDEAGGRLGNSRAIRRRLQEISRAGDTLSGLRDTHLGLSRIAGYVPEAAQHWVTPELATHLATVRSDLASVADYLTRLQDKAQFLLDATLGFINIDQNDTFRILTVVSVVGIPPTLLASIWGMNFESMPELKAPHAYYFALLAIATSALLPLLWFRRKGWL